MLPYCTWPWLWMSFHKAHCLLFYSCVHLIGHKSQGNNFRSQVREFLQSWHKQPKSCDTYSQQDLTSPKACNFQHIRVRVGLKLNKSGKGKKSTRLRKYRRRSKGGKWKSWLSFRGVWAAMYRLTRGWNDLIVHLLRRVKPCWSPCCSSQTR